MFTSKEVMQIISPNKVKLITLPEGFKDANQMLLEGKEEQFRSAWWSAKSYSPAGIVNILDYREEFHNRVEPPSVPYPWSGLNKELGGIREGELITLGAGTGVGKSSVTRELIHHLLTTTSDNVGILSLEENMNRTLAGILSIEANARLHIPEVNAQFTKEEIYKFYNNIFRSEQGQSRAYIYEDLGVTDIDEIFAILRSLIMGMNCKYIVLDHLHMLVNKMYGGDERRDIDYLMIKLRGLVESTKCALILVSHLKRIDGNSSHENGAETSLSHLRGSQSIAQVSDIVIGLERKQQAEEEVERNTLTFRVLKNRWTGLTGEAGYVIYDRETGRLNEEEF